MPRSATRKPTLRQPRVRKKTVHKRKKTVRKAKATARKRVLRKTVARKPALRKAVASKTKVRKKTASKVVASKATASKVTRRKVAAGKARGRKPDRLDRVEANLEQVGVRLDKVAVAQEKTSANLDKVGVRLDKVGVRLDEVGIRLDKLGIEVDKTVASVRELRKSVGGLDNKWGDFSEGLLIGDVEKTLNKFKGIEVNARNPNAEITYKGKTWEIDCLAIGDDMVVVIEAKASLTKGHIGKFIGNILERFTDMMPAYRGLKIYGAVGYLNAKEDVVTFAQRKGLLVLRSVHETKELVGVTSKFKLRNFHP